MLWNVTEALWDVTERYRAVTECCGALQSRYGMLQKHCGSITRRCRALRNITYRCRMLQDIMEHCRSIADCYGSITELLRNITEPLWKILILPILTHTQPFYSSLDLILDNLGEPVPEETFTHSHLSWSSIIPYLLPLSITIHSILSVQFTCTICLKVFFGLPLDLAPSTSYSIDFFIQSLSSFCSRCPYHRNLFCCSTDIMLS